MILADVKVGDIIVADGGFTCLKAGPHPVRQDEHGLYVECGGPDNEGGGAGHHHYLDGQEDEEGNLVGFSMQETVG